VKPGQLDSFKELMEEMGAGTSTEAETLNYEWRELLALFGGIYLLLGAASPASPGRDHGAVRVSMRVSHPFDAALWEKPRRARRRAAGTVTVMGVAGVSIVIAAASVVAASTFYSFQIRNQLRVRKTDLVMRLYTTWDSLEFQRAFHTVYWADFHDYDSAMAITGGERQLWT
jgi:hypothetical protein